MHREKQSAILNTKRVEVAPPKRKGFTKCRQRYAGDLKADNDRLKAQNAALSREIVQTHRHAEIEASVQTRQ